jgi:hypothetical protein
MVVDLAWGPSGNNLNGVVPQIPKEMIMLLMAGLSALLALPLFHSCKMLVN